MVKLLSTIFMVLTIVLFPPATLALISNDAVPGQPTYPIKRSIENLILTTASINPSTKAWFNINQTERRFKEATTLIAQGQSATTSLGELVSQTDTAVIQIDRVENVQRKQQLISDLSVSITKYDQGLKAASDTIEQSFVATTKEGPTVIYEPPTQQPSSKPQPQQSPSPSVTAEPAKVVQVVTDTRPGLLTQKDIEETRKKLEEIQKKLKQKTGTEEQKTKVEQQPTKNDNSKDSRQESSSSSGKTSQ